MFGHLVSHEIAESISDTNANTIVKGYDENGRASFEYSHSYSHFLAFLKIGFKIAYGTVQGIIRGLSITSGLKNMHFAHIRRA
jgi:hypothetical protein